MAKRRIVFVVLAGLACGIACSTCEARLAWSGHPGGGTFLLTESGLYVGTELGAQADIGIMTNIAATSALGVTAHGMIAGDVDTATWGTMGAAARYRRWLGGGWVLDGAAHLQVRVVEREWEAPRPGGSLAIGRGDWIALCFVVDRYETRETAYCLGIRLGRYLGAPGALLLATMGVAEAAR